MAEKAKTEIIHLFKDNGRYSGARFVSVNGEAYLKPARCGRGSGLRRWPRCCATARRWTTQQMRRSRRRLQKRRTYLHCSGCKTARRHCAAACWQVTGKLKRIDTRYGRHMLCPGVFGRKEK